MNRKIDLMVEQAKLEFGMRETKTLPDLACRMLEEDSDTPSVRILAGLEKHEISEIRESWLSALEELGFNWPTKEEMAWTLIEHVLDEIIEGTMDPHEGIHTIIYDIYHQMDWDDKNKEYAGDSIGIQALYGLCVECDDLSEATEPWFKDRTNQSFMDELKGRIVQEAVKYRAKTKQYRGKLEEEV